MELIGVIAGMLLGIFSGLLPGVHTNTVIAVLMGMGIEPGFLSFVIVATFAAHIVFEFFPAIFLGVPDETTVVSVLPGQRLLLEGKGVEGLRICAVSILCATCLSILLFPVSLAVFPFIYSLIKPIMLPLLVGGSVLLLATEGEWKKVVIALVVFLLAGAIGLITLNGGISEPLFPSFTGMFAVSSLMVGSSGSRKLPRQETGPFEFDFKRFIVIGVMLGMLADLFPGIGAPAQIAVFASIFLSLAPRSYLALTSSVAVSHAVFAFGSLLTIQKARVGALIALGQVADITLSSVPIFLSSFLVVVGIASLLLILFSRAAKSFCSLNFQALNAILLLYLIILVFVVSGPIGLLLLGTASALGAVPILLGVRRTHLMGLIMVPTMLLLSGL
jgi:putative membrane protein